MKYINIFCLKHGFGLHKTYHGIWLLFHNWRTKQFSRIFLFPILLHVPVIHSILAWWVVSADLLWNSLQMSTDSFLKKIENKRFCYIRIVAKAMWISAIASQAHLVPQNSSQATVP